MTPKKSNECPICSQAMEAMLEFHKLPLTEMYEPYSETSFEEGRGLVDQTFLFCPRCSHGKLETIVPPAVLYGEGYRTRSAASAGSRRAIQNFAAFLTKHLPMDRITTAIDIGANDSTLLTSLNCHERVAIDPNASGEGVTLLKAYIENVDLEPYRRAPKVILSSHTLEHIEKPDAFFSKINAVLMSDDYVALQFPSLELLVKDARIEQIHHQHIHYFSFPSIANLLARYSLEIVAHRFDSDHYGALMVIARRGKGATYQGGVDEKAIMGAKQWFDHAMLGCGMLIAGRKFVGFGAALMLPLFAYHLPILNEAEYIADNDASKNGLRYINFNVPIRSEYDLRDKNVIITALNTKLAGRALARLAWDAGARNVFIPHPIT